MAELIGLTGKSGAGKTKVCQDIIQVANRADLSVFGLYCPGVFDGEEKIGIEVRLLPGEVTYLLGSLEKQKNWQPIGRWWMNPNVFELVNNHLRTYTSSDLLLIDEIGPAEIEGHQGWCGALNVLKDNHFQEHRANRPQKKAHVALHAANQLLSKPDPQPKVSY